MRWSAAPFIAVTVVAFGTTPMPSASASTAAGHNAVAATSGVWGTAQPVPGLSPIDKGNFAKVMAVSCPSAGDCAAGGIYLDSSHHTQGFVVDEVNGRWGRAEPVPGLGVINRGGDAQISVVSCAAAGDCSAAGTYARNSADYRAFVVSEVNGRWRTAIEIPGTAGFDTGSSDAIVTAISCPSRSYCAVGGYVQEGPVFVDSEVRGKWKAAQQVPGLGKLNMTGGFAGLASLSCGAPGWCAAGGHYTDKSDDLQGFVVTESGGTWGNAEEIPGTAALNKGPNSLGIYSVSCPSARGCTAVGEYEDNEGGAHPLVVSETNGFWDIAKTVSGTGGGSLLDTVSCTSPGKCTAGGELYVGAARWQAFIVTQTAGLWGKAKQVPGVAALNKAGFATVTGVSCTSPGYCSATGYYDPSNSSPHAFVVSEVKGTWGKGLPVRGSVVQGRLSEITSISCAGPGNCGAGGWTLGHADYNAFLVSQATKATTSTALKLSRSTASYGAESRERLSVTVTSSAGVPAGRVTVKTAAVTVCQITLRNGKGSCVLKNRQLPVGSHRLVATYPGDARHFGSASARKTLKVIR